MRSISVNLSGVESAMLEEIARARRGKPNLRALIISLISEEYSRLGKR